MCCAALPSQCFTSTQQPVSLPMRPNKSIDADVPPAGFFRYCPSFRRASVEEWREGGGLSRPSSCSKLLFRGESDLSFRRCFCGAAPPMKYRDGKTIEPGDLVEIDVHSVAVWLPPWIGEVSSWLRALGASRTRHHVDTDFGGMVHYPKEATDELVLIARATV
jgi:hypothetical protein